MTRSPHHFSINSDMDKSEFRKISLKKRAELFSDASEKEQADIRIYNNILTSDILKGIKQVLVYVSYRHETDTLRLIDYLLSENVRVAVPRCRKEGMMDFFVMNSLSELKPSAMGIPEPEYTESSMVRDFSDTLCIVPGTAFDLKGNRTGYGGGYYDRFISAEKDIITAGLCYHSLVYDEVPSEPHDQSVDYIITEKGIINING